MKRIKKELAEIKAEELRMTLNTEMFLKSYTNHSLFPKGNFRVEKKNKENHEVFFKNKFDNFSLTLADDKLFESIYIGQKIRMK